MTAARVEAGLLAGVASGVGFALCALGLLWTVERALEAVR